MNATLKSGCDIAHLPTVDEALALVRDNIQPVAETEVISLYCAAGRVLARDAVALVTVPPCDRSAMDGFAFRAGGQRKLRLIGRALAGNPFTGSVAADECVAIATGGSLPHGCDTVAMREHCRQTADGVYAEAVAGSHLRRAGEDFRAGDLLVASGTRLDARHLALLASAGLEQLVVRRRPRVAIFSIGDELMPGAPDRIYDANRAMLWGFCHGLGAVVTDLGILPDRRDQLAVLLRNAAGDHDAILSSAGTSVGDEDHVLAAILESGGVPLLSGVAIKPGKPVAFGRIGASLYIALPGNPAAALVNFAALGAPLLRHLAGANPPTQIWSKVRAGFSWRKKPGLREYLRVTLAAGPDGVPEALSPAKQGSAMLASMASSHGLVALDESQTAIAPGTQIPFCSFAELLAP